MLVIPMLVTMKFYCIRKLTYRIVLSKICLTIHLLSAKLSSPWLSSSLLNRASAASALSLIPVVENFIEKLNSTQDNLINAPITSHFIAFFWQFVQLYLSIFGRIVYVILNHSLSVCREFLILKMGRGIDLLRGMCIGRYLVLFLSVYL